MTTLSLNDNWHCGPCGEPESRQAVTLPHDAMIREGRSGDNPGGTYIAFHKGGDYEYTRTLFIPSDYADKTVLLEFEGVYKNAQVFINGKLAAERPYGYTGFLVEAGPYLRFGEDNQLAVRAFNADQPNSRWYSGSGIYRPVFLHVAPKDHILPGGIRIKTLSIEPPAVEITVATSAPGPVEIRIQEGSAPLYSRTVESDGITVQTIELPRAKLWNAEHPDLYTCAVRFKEDSEEAVFGIRQLSWSAAEGFTINGKRTILRGACIHHDNGLLGACAYEDAERRKVRILKENGYNAIRSAHNPCSKALLKACDELGMYVMDEYVDLWYIHKTRYDYADLMETWWKDDLKDMVRKDYNHPSVILYSTGNEVSETAQERGIKLAGDMTRYLHGIDGTRPVTCGVNIFFNYLSSLGFGVYTDEKAKKQKNQPVGSEFFNALAGLLGDKAMKLGATLHGCDAKTRDAFANMDMAGYNYGILRYKKDLKRYPDRLILGTETFCKDAYSFWEFARNNRRIIGDFVWAGMDYIGEVGIGAWEYEDYAPRNAPKSGWLTAGSGRIDITGKPNAEAAYTRVALERETGPLIAVKPVYQRGKHSPSAWKMTEALESWSWRGCEGFAAVVEVYARAASVELFVNARSAGRKKLKKDCRAIFTAPYADGSVEAIAYDKSGRELGRKRLETAGLETELRAEPESKTVRSGGLAFVRLRYTDSRGITKPMEKHSIRIVAEGGTVLGFGNACSYNPEGYLNKECKTYYGEALAIVKADAPAGNGAAPRLTLSFRDEEREAMCRIPIEE